MATCCSVLGIVSLVLTDLAIVISWATPYWIQFKGEIYQGLFARCEQDSCQWFFEDNYLTSIDTEEKWWISVQGLVSVGLGLGLLCILLATIALCCDCRSCNSSISVGWLLILAFLSLATGAVVFGVCAHKFEEVQMDFDMTHGMKFGWAFWLDAVAAGMALLTGLIYIVDGNSKKI